MILHLCAPSLIALLDHARTVPVKLGTGANGDTQWSNPQLSFDSVRVLLHLEPVLDFQGSLTLIVLTGSFEEGGARVIWAVVFFPHGPMRLNEVPSPVLSATTAAIVLYFLRLEFKLSDQVLWGVDKGAVNQVLFGESSPLSLL